MKTLDEKQLEYMFDYQEFEHNGRIDSMLADAEERLDCYVLCDDELDLVAGGVTVVDGGRTNAMKRGMGHSDS